MRYRDDAGVPVLFVPKRSCGSHSTSGRLARPAQRAHLKLHACRGDCTRVSGKELLTRDSSQTCILRRQHGSNACKQIAGMNRL